MRNFITVFLIIAAFYACDRGGRVPVYHMEQISDTTFFKDWLLLGPFPNGDIKDSEGFIHGEACRGFFEDYLKSAGGESACSPEEGDNVKVEKLNITRSWRYYHSPENRVLLNRVYPESDQIVSYAFCEIVSPAAKKMILSLGSNDGIRVFLNGKLVVSVHPKGGRGLFEDENLIPVDLQKGSNRLLLKIENGFGGYGYALRLLSPGSAVLREIKNRGKPAVLSVGDIKAVFIDNYRFGKNHKSGYNGIAELYHSRQSSNLFVPYYAGFNLEHIFGGDSLPVIFEPRKSPLSIEKISDREVRLHQPPTPLSHCESWTTFKMTAPHYIDVHFRCAIHSLEFFKHGYAGLFWASYINAPDDKKIYFLSKEKKRTKWIGVYSPAHGKNSTYLGKNDNKQLYMAENFNVVLAKSFSKHRFVKPFYFGHYKNMVFAYFFSVSDEQIIRFSQSPNGGGDKNPAWDFQFIIPEVKAGKSYEFSARLLYKKYINNQDILNEYENWKKEIEKK